MGVDPCIDPNLEPVKLLAATLIVAALSCCWACSTLPARHPDSISFNISEDPDSLNPLQARSEDEEQLSRLVFDPLIDVDASGKLIPDLAIAVPTIANGGVSPDGRTITYHLRRGVRWQDGVPFTSRDVWYTWRAIVDPRSLVESTRGYVLISSIATPNAYTAIVRLRRPWAPAVATLFSQGVYPEPIVPAHLHPGGADDPSFATHPVGTGPYELSTWQRGDALTYVANPSYFRGAPKTRELIVREVPDINTDLTMLRSGDLDWSLLSPAQRLAAAGTPHVRFVYAPFAGFGAIAFDCRHAPFDDVRMRRAIAMAIDRPRLSQDITQDQYPVTDTDQPAFSWARDDAIREPGFNPRAADAALDDMGWRRGADGVRRKNGVPLSIVFATFPEGDTAVRTSVMVQAMLAQRGIQVFVKRVTIAQFYLPKSEGGLLMSGKFDLAYIAWKSGADPDDSDLLDCGGSANFAGSCDPRIDALEARALDTPDVRRRTSFYHAIQAIAAHDLPYLYVYAPRYGYAVRDDIGGLSPTPFSPTWNAYVWVKHE